MENTEHLYKFLIDDFGFEIVEREFPPKYFDNFFFTLSTKDNNFLIRYVNDRSFLRIEISSKLEPSNWYDVASVKALIYSEEEITERNIDVLNSFIKGNIDKINALFSKESYPETKNQLEELQNRRTKNMFPGLNK